MDMTVTSAQYIADPANSKKITAVKAVIDGRTYFVPLDPANRHYAEILRQVEAGTLTIQDAD